MVGGGGCDLFWSFFTQRAEPLVGFGLAGDHRQRLGVDNRIKLGEALRMILDW